MSDGDAFEFNNTVNGHGAQINQGKNVTATQTNTAGDNSAFDRFLACLKAELPDSHVNQLDAEVLEPFRKIASEPEPENEQDRLTLKARIMALVANLEPYAPFVRKTIAAFAEGALGTIPPPAGWIIAGCIEVVRDARRD